jgi:hypothetical protein
MSQQNCPGDPHAKHTCLGLLPPASVSHEESLSHVKPLSQHLRLTAPQVCTHLPAAQSSLAPQCELRQHCWHPLVHGLRPAAQLVAHWLPLHP